jgi:hypothetical protein
VDSSAALPPSAAKVSRNSFILGCKSLTLHLNTFSVFLQVGSDKSLEISASDNATISLNPSPIVEPQSKSDLKRKPLNYRFNLALAAFPSSPGIDASSILV